MKAEFIKNYHNNCSIYINEQNKWAWLRIHKNAGTSMYDGFLIDHCINYPQNKPKQALKWMKQITDQELDQYFIWTCVRNPYDRFMSMSAMFSSDPNKFARGFHHYRTKGIIKRHTEPQHIYTHHNGVQIPNMIIKFEDVEDGFKKVCEIIGLPILGVMEWMNASEHGSWGDEMNRETMDFVNEFYKLDFKYFNYLML